MFIEYDSPKKRNLLRTIFIDNLYFKKHWNENCSLKIIFIENVSLEKKISSKRFL